MSRAGYARARGNYKVRLPAEHRGGMIAPVNRVNRRKSPASPAAILLTPTLERPPRRRVGVMIDTTWVYGRTVLRGVIAYGMEKGWRFHRRVVWMGEPTNEIPQWDVDGFIISAFTPEMDEAIAKLTLPVVNVSGRDHLNPTPSVAPDDSLVGVMAVDHFVERGFQRLAIVLRSGASWSDRRRDAFRKRCAERKVAADEFVEMTAPEAVGFPSPSEEMRRWMRSLAAPTALFCVDDSLAESVVECAEETGRRVPEELAVLGVGNDRMVVTMTTPPLSSVELPGTKIGYEAAHLLETMMAGETPAQTKIFVPPPRVVVRQSSDLIAMTDPDVSMAVTYIRDHAMTLISVSDVVNNASLSRRPLEKRFNRVLGRSILEEIHRAHVERAKEMLVSTDLSIQQIATASGFANTTRFGVTFRRETSLTPSEYRAKNKQH